MKCPYCSYPESKVVDSRHSDDGLSIRRRRECLQCQRRFTTYETVESLPIVVVKKDGSRQSFAGLVAAFEELVFPNHTICVQTSQDARKTSPSCFRNSRRIMRKTL